jgi:hypothetical protein
LTGSDIDREEDMQEESKREKIDRKRWTEIDRDIGGDRERRKDRKAEKDRERQWDGCQSQEEKNLGRIRGIE